MTNQLQGGLAALALAQHGLFNRQQALSSGYTDGDIQRLTRNNRVWRRLRRGVFTEAANWDRLDPRSQHVLLVRAALAHVQEVAVASHWSAAAVLGLDTYKPDLSLIHLTRTNAHSPRTEAGVHHHSGRLREEEVITVDGVPVTSLARTVIDIARISRESGFESGLVTADCALRLGLDANILKDQLLSQSDWSGSRNAARVVLHSDGRSESPGETLCRAAFINLKLPAPELQANFTSGTDGRSFRTDFYWPEYRTVCEFDGREKYFRGLHPGEAPGDRIWREKKREDRLRHEFGVEVVRVTWSDLLPERRVELLRRILAAFERGAARVRVVSA